jgi:hypothetical protein
VGLGIKEEIMRRIFWFLLIPIYVIPFVLIYNYIPVYFNVPKWSASFFYLCGFFLAIEVFRRLNPKAHKGAFSFVWESAIQDKIVFLILTTGMVIFNLFQGYLLKNIPVIIGFIISIANLWLFKILINLFGSSEFKQGFKQNVKFW